MDLKILRTVAGLLLMFVMCNTQAQNEELLHKYSILKGDAIRIADEEGSSKISGSPYLEKDFQKGFIYFKDHPALAADLRYDIVKEEMQLRMTDLERYQVLQDGVDVSINGVPFQKLNYRGEDGRTMLGYFEVLTAEHNEKPLLLLNKHYKHVKTGTRSEARGFPPKYVDKSDYFLKFKDARFAVPAESRLNNFLAAFPLEHQGELRSFIQNNKLKPRKSDDLQQIVTHYNQMLQQ